MVTDTLITCTIIPVLVVKLELSQGLNFVDENLVSFGNLIFVFETD